MRIIASSWRPPERESETLTDTGEPLKVGASGLITSKGEANVFFGPGAPRPGSVFARIEGPILYRQGNPIVQHFLDAP